MRSRVVCLLAVLTFLVLPGAARADTVSFQNVGVGQSWTVPAGVTQATFDLYGAQGGSASTSGGKGGRVRATLAVTPGEFLVLFVGGTGGQAATGFNGGGKGGTGSGTFTAASRAYGGGGATDLRRGGVGLGNRLMVAAGGGGASRNGAGGASGASGSSSGGNTGGGGAATPTAVGAAGCAACGNTGNPGLYGVGGAGQESGPSDGGGGGGGGVYGGGGGGGDSSSYDGGGGGGSSQVAPAGSVVSDALLQDGVRSGEGAATVTFTASSAPAGTTGGQGTPSLVDTVKPVLGRLGLSRSSFAAASSGASTSAKRKGKAKKKPVGTKVSYSLSEPGSVRFRVERKATGRKVGKRCVAPKRSNRKKKKCTRWTAVRGSFTVAGKAGRNSFTFRGRVGGRALRRGTYQLTGVATDGAKNASARVKRTFKII